MGILDNTCASGSRRTCAAAVLANSLCCADVVAAVVAPEHADRVAEALRRELCEHPGTELLPLGDAAPEPEHARRAVLLWSGVDSLIDEEPERFEEAVRTLGSRLEGGAARKAVLIGGDALFNRLEDVCEYLPETLRFRYVLIQ
jgi:hypothetical protein